jgi:hypothetical protein
MMAKIGIIPQFDSCLVDDRIEDATIVGGLVASESVHVVVVHKTAPVANRPGYSTVRSIFHASSIQCWIVIVGTR